MDKYRRSIGAAMAMAALMGCASAPEKVPPEPLLQSASTNSSGTESTSFVGTWKEADTSPASEAVTTPGVVVYGSVPQRQQQQPPTAPTVPCGLASLAWTFTHPEDAWRILAPLLPEQNVDACLRNTRGDAPDSVSREVPQR